MKRANRPVGTRRPRRTLLGLLTVFCCFGLFQGNPHADEDMPVTQVSGGANIGWLTDGNSTAGVEISFTYLYLTGSFGFDRLQEGRSYFYGEACFWFFLNVGLGAGGLTEESTWKYSGHLFLGLPVPIPALSGRSAKIPSYFAFVQPYWRPILQFDGWKSAGNEFGVLIKGGFRVELF